MIGKVALAIAVVVAFVAASWAITQLVFNVVALVVLVGFVGAAFRQVTS